MRVGHHVRMTPQWKRLGAELRKARKAAGISQVDLAQAVGIGRSTVQAVERGKEYTKPAAVHRVIARAVGWTDESIELVLAGGEPEALAPPIAQAVERNVESAVSSAGDRADLDLPLRIVQEMEEGRLLDAQVIDLGGDSSARMIVVVKGAPDATPEQIRRDLRAWRDAQEALEDRDGRNRDGSEASTTPG